MELGTALAWIDTLGKRKAGEKIMLLHIIYTLGNEPDRQVEGSAILMAKIMGMSGRSFQRHVSILKPLGIIKVENTKIKGGRGYIGSNRYSLPLWAEFCNKAVING